MEEERRSAAALAGSGERTVRMSVVLISRGSMSGVTLLIDRLKERTGVRCVSREDLVRRVNRHGELASRIVNRLDKATREYEQFCDLRRPYIILMRAALLEFAVHDDVVYHGYSGHLLVPPISHFLRVRIDAPLEMRTRMTRERRHCSQEEAEDYVRRDDEDRVRWARFMYGKDIRDPALYDVCTNLGRLCLDTVCNLISDLLEDPGCEPSAASARAVEELLRATQVEAALATDPRTSAVEASAQASAGHVVVTGPYLLDAQREAVLEVARGVEGAGEVEYRYGYAAPVGV